MGLIGNRNLAGLPGIPDTTALDTSLPAPPPPGETPRPAGFFGRLGQIDWGSTLLGGLADGIAMWGGAKPGYATSMAQRASDEQELKKAELLNRFRVEAEQRARRERDGEILDTFNTDNGDVMGILGNGMTSLLSKGGGPKKTPLMQNFDWYSELTPEQRAMADRSGLLGGNSEYAYGQKRGLKQTVPGKAPSAGGGGGKPTATRVVDGVTYRKINGRWYR